MKRITLAIVAAAFAALLTTSAGASDMICTKVDGSTRYLQFEDTIIDQRLDAGEWSTRRVYTCAPAGPLDTVGCANEFGALAIQLVPDKGMAILAGNGGGVRPTWVTYNLVECANV